MIRNALDVLHHCDRIFEDRRVDPLQDDSLSPPAVIKVHAIGIVNVPAAVRLHALESSLNFKHTHDSGEALLVDHGHSLWG